MARITRQIRVSGHVQGVFFRAWIRDQARELGVNGWVRNCDDGSVEAHLEGEAVAVEELIEHVRSGPPAARAETMEISEAPSENLSAFEVRH